MEKTPNAMEGILSMILANMASANGSIVNTITPAHSDITNQSENSSSKESKIAKKKDNISAKEPEV
ncbi:hypothetical protein DFR90_005327 [Clostridium beijerinckii]|nr:hypothetical protein [Clostridium beijerinckii]